MPDLAAIRRLHQHRDWVNRRLRASARKLSPAQLDQAFDIGQGSLMKTLTHLHAAEAVWVLALQGVAQTPSPFHFRFDSLTQLESAWDESEHAWTALLASLTEGDLNRPITKTASLSGETFTTPMLDILLHVCTHAQYTTAQAVNMMRRLGVPADQLPDPMLITMSREEQSAHR